MLLDLNAIRPRETRPDDAFDAACAENRAVLGAVGNEAFRAGSISAAGMTRLLGVILPHWRPSGKKPYKGYLVLGTTRGGRRLSHRHLAEFFAVQTTTLDQRMVSARTIQRVLQVVGAAHLAAGGETTKIETLVLALFDEGCLTPAGLLEKARNETEWGAVLRRAQRSAKEKRARIRRLFRESLEDEDWPRPELESFQAEIAAALAQQREAHLRVVPPSARELRWPQEGVRAGNA